MTPKLTDTTPEAERVLLRVYRTMPPGQKWLQLGRMYDDARALHAAGVRLRYPAATAGDVRADWLAAHLGVTLTGAEPAPGRSPPMQNLHDLREVLRVLTGLDIAYALGGSMASSVHGIDRYTRDADVTAEPFPGREAALAAAFGPDYYKSLPAIQDAVRRRSTFNIINTATGFKVDVFVRADSPFEQSPMARRIALTFPDLPGEPVYLHTPEDVVLFKLRRYRLGGGASAQQWADVLGVLRVQGDRLDPAYLDRWAADLGVVELLARARAEGAV